MSAPPLGSGDPQRHCAKPLLNRRAAATRRPSIEVLFWPKRWMEGTVAVVIRDQCYVLVNVHPKQGSLRKYIFHLSAVLILYVMAHSTSCIYLYFCRPMESCLPLSDVTNTIDSCVAKRFRATTKNTSDAGRVCSFLILISVILFVNNDSVQYSFLISVILFVDNHSVQ